MPFSEETGWECVCLPTTLEYLLKPDWVISVLSSPPIHPFAYCVKIDPDPSNPCSLPDGKEVYSRPAWFVHRVPWKRLWERRILLPRSTVHADCVALPALNHNTTHGGRHHPATNSFLQLPLSHGFKQHPTARHSHEQLSSTSYKIFQSKSQSEFTVAPK